MKTLLLSLLLISLTLEAAPDSNEWAMWNGKEFVSIKSDKIPPRTPDGELLINPWTQGCEPLPENTKPTGKWQIFMQRCGVSPTKLLRESIVEAYLRAYLVIHPPK